MNQSINQSIKVSYKQDLRIANETSNAQGTRGEREHQQNAIHDREDVVLRQGRCMKHLHVDQDLELDRSSKSLKVQLDGHTHTHTHKRAFACEYSSVIMIR